MTPYPVARMIGGQGAQLRGTVGVADHGARRDLRMPL